MNQSRGKKRDEFSQWLQCNPLIKLQYGTKKLPMLATHRKPPATPVDRVTEETISTEIIAINKKKLFLR